MNENITFFYEDTEITPEQFARLFNDPIARRTKMSEPLDYPIKLEGIPPHVILDLKRNLHEIQKEMFPNTPVKHIPIPPGTEQATIHLVLSAILRLPSTIPHQTPHSIGFGNEQFWLTFTIK